MELLESFVRIFDVPPAMVPYIHMAVEPAEMELVVRLGQQWHAESEAAAAAAELLGMPQHEAQAVLTRAFQRHILDRDSQDGAFLYRSATFYERLDPLSMYENWGDVPAEARDAVIQWQLQEFISKHQPAIEEIMKNPDAYVRIPNRDVLLLEEALAQVEAATEHVVVPCDCRAIVMACQRPSEACIRLDDGARYTLERGMGRKVTKEECKQILIDVDRAGLMHTGSRTSTDEHHFGMCSCCACDCYPFRASMQLGLDKAWPRSHYIAERDETKCAQCGKCAQRCHFGAFHLDGTRVEVQIKGKARLRKHVAFDSAKCWGCGLCATTCPDGAIHMQSLAAADIK